MFNLKEKIQPTIFAEKEKYRADDSFSKIIELNKSSNKLVFILFYLFIFLNLNMYFM